ncbi:MULTISPECIES: four helix bundle protein [unclassified Dysgonomonas]|jgi:four helix bundle protein|uniref:four helix bundle protein n=1 Tax=unclassified Dysgonomonas TaxID=2630389 RepID=UPI0025B996E1|nr:MULTISPECIES: four helix bundle protein [unclassified Dysgonomonas]MDR2003872.1 four helix bundle protein [Prevotella sp.]HMM03305.1 four helix bundle protein [Dysgonomonas sp.]
MDNNENIIRKEKSILVVKSYVFAIKIVNLIQFLQKEKSEYVLSKQVLRSGTAVGALIREAEFAQSKSDFVHKLSIALKEANETDYWICLLKDTNYISVSEYESLASDCSELIYILISSVKTVKNKLSEK